MAETQFSVAYDGPALADGKMPVRELAPALLALGDVFAGASRLLYPDREPVALNIKATSEGSFLVWLILESQEAWDELIDIFGSDVANALANLRDAVIGGAGLFWLVKRLKGRKVVSQEPDPKPGWIRLALDDGTTIEIPAEVLSMYQSIEIRTQAKQVVSPLTREGIERVTFTAPQSKVVIEKADVSAYELPEMPEDTLLDQEREMVLEIASVSFTEGKWRFSDGEHSFWAALEDASFLERVRNGVEAFRQGDMLRCRVRIVQLQRNGGLHTEWSVVEVVEHIPRLTQLSLEDEATP